MTLKQLKILKEIGVDITRYYNEEMGSEPKSFVCGSFGCATVNKDNTINKPYY